MSLSFLKSYGLIALLGGALGASLCAREETQPKPKPKSTAPEPLSISGEKNDPNSSALGGGDDFGSGKVNYDEISGELIKRLSKGEKEASDAAFKLSQMGKRVIVPLSNILKTSKNDDEKYWAALALSKVRNKNAAKALVPVMLDDKANSKLRMLAMDAASGENIDEAIEPLKILAKNPDAELSMHAYSALSVMIQAWPSCEGLFTTALEDPNSEVRSLAVTVCLQAAVYKTPFKLAEDKLLAMLKSETELVTLKCKAMAALGRMKSGRTVPILIELLNDPEIAPAALKQTLGTLQTITEVPLRDVAGAQKWWEKFGKTRYENAPPLVLPEDQLKAVDATLTRDANGNLPATPRPGKVPPSDDLGVDVETHAADSEPAARKTLPPPDPQSRREDPHLTNDSTPPPAPLPKHTAPSTKRNAETTQDQPPTPPPARRKLLDDDSGSKPFSGVMIDP